MIRSLSNQDEGMYIVIEGDEGAGKTEQAHLLVEALKLRGIRVQYVREPGGDPFAEELREMLKHSPHPIDPMAEVFGFSTARANMLAKVVRPMLDAGTWVVSDRSYTSTIALQGYGHGLRDDARFVNMFTSSGIPGDPRHIFTQLVMCAIVAAQPHIEFILDIPLDIALERGHARDALENRVVADRYEDAGLEFRRRVNDGYRNLARFNGSYRGIDGNRDRQSVHAEIMQGIVWLIAWGAGITLEDDQYVISRAATDAQQSKKALSTIHQLTKDLS